MSESTAYQLDFLWAAYFGIKRATAERSEGAAIDACCYRAYRDLSRTLKYTHSSSELDSWTKEKKKAYIKIRDGYIDNVVEKLRDRCMGIPTEEGAFNQWHRDACEKIISLAGEQEGLFKVAPTVGQAQKWVNMTLKYMLVMGLERMEALKPVLHVPVDSYMIEAAKEKEENGLGVDPPSDTWTWSKIDDYGTYLSYQKAIKEAAIKKGYKTAIDWEGDAWSDIAAKKAKRKRIVDLGALF